MTANSTYCTAEEVADLVGDVISNADEDTPNLFGAGTRPTRAAVERFIAQVSARINVRLRNAYYTVPVQEEDDEVAYQYVKYLAICGAAAYVLGTKPAEAYLGEAGQNPSMGRKQHYEKMLQEGLTLIDKQMLGAIVTNDNVPNQNFVVGSSVLEGGYATSIFRRNLFAYNGPRD